MSSPRFTGTDQYVATDELMMAVNAAITLARPLLISPWRDWISLSVN